MFRKVTVSLDVQSTLPDLEGPLRVPFYWERNAAWQRERQNWSLERYASKKPLNSVRSQKKENSESQTQVRSKKMFPFFVNFTGKIRKKTNHEICRRPCMKFEFYFSKFFSQAFFELRNLHPLRGKVDCVTTSKSVCVWGSLKIILPRLTNVTQTINLTQTNKGDVKSYQAHHITHSFASTAKLATADLIYCWKAWHKISVVETVRQPLWL